jgi:YVTN family beta-propeller protein
VSDAGSDSVWPVTVATHSVGASIPVGGEPSAMAVNPQGTDVYVANTGTGTVSVISTATNTVTAHICVGASPEGAAVSPDGTRVYVANTGSDTVSVISTTTNTIIGTIGVGWGPKGLAVTPDGASVYVANSDENTVSVIDASTDSIAATDAVGATGSRPVAVAITPDQAPVAAVTAAPSSAGTPSRFDASSSAVAFGSIASYRWDFGDGSTASTTSATTTHTYAAAGSYTASVTETSTGGTSTAQVFTGQTVSQNGGAGAVRSITVVVPPSTPPVPPPSPNPIPPPHPPGPSPSPVPTPIRTLPIVTPVSPQPQPQPPSPAPNPLPAPIRTLPFFTPIHPSPSHHGQHPPGRLSLLPASGNPGLGVRLAGRGLARTCRPDHTVYVFFDNQLVGEAQVVGHVVSDSDIVIPGDASAGAHHFALSCADTDAGAMLASTSFTVVDTANHPTGWITSLPHPGKMHNDSSTWAKATVISIGLLVLILIYLLGFPAEWFNDTYDANEERMLDAARRRFPRLMARLAAIRAAVATDRRPARGALLFAGFVTLAALIQSALDPHFGLSTSSLWLFLGWCAGITIVTLGFQLPSLLFGVRTRHRVTLRVLAGSILVAALCVFVSRLLALEPGYCYGLIAVFALRPVVPEKVAGRLAAVSALFVLLLSLAAWAAWVPIQRAASHPHPSPALLVLEAGLGVVFILGIESVSFGMLPLPFLPGRDVAAWNRWAWSGIFILGLTAFVWTLLQPGSGFASEVHHVDLIPVIAACAGFAAVTLAFMAYFKLRKAQSPSTEEDSPVGLVG